MNKRFSKLVATLLVTAMIIGAMPFIMPAKAAPPLPPAFWIMPQTEAFDTNTAYVGYRFNVTAWVATTAAQSYDWQAAIYYDFTYLNNTGVWMSATPNNDMSQWFKTNGVVNTVYNGYNIATGNDLGLNYTLVGESLKAGSPGPQFIPPSSGSLFIAEFEIMSAPAPGNTLTSLIQFSPPGAVWSSIVDDPLGQTEPGFSFGSCAYSFAWIAPAAITPQIVNFTTNYFNMYTNWIGATFNEVVEFTGVGSGWFMTNATADFLYNSTLLAVTNVAFDPLWTGTNSYTFPIAGDLSMFVQNPSSTPSGTVVLATITFQILNQDNVPPKPYAYHDNSQRTLTNLTAYSSYNSVGLITMNAFSPVPDIWVFAYLTAPPPFLCVTGASLGPNPSYGATFVVNVTLNDVAEPSQHLIGVQYRLLFDDTYLEPILVEEGPFFPYWATQEDLAGYTPASYPPGTFFVSFINDSYGTYGANILLGHMILPNNTGYWNEPLPNGDGVIAIITFKVIYPISYGEQNICTSLHFATDSSMEAIGLDNMVSQNVVDVQLGPPCESQVCITWDWPGRMLDLYGGAVNSYMIPLDDQPIPQFVPPYGGQGLGAPMDLVEPQSWVYLNANVTYNYFPVQHKNVAFEVQEPDGTVYTKMTAFTDEYGVASVGFRMPWPCDDPESLFGIWHVTSTVQLADNLTQDTMDFKYNFLVTIFKVTTDAYQYAHPGNTVGLPYCVQITFDYGSLAMQYYPALFVISIVDNLGVTVGIATVETTIGGAVYCTWANGSATVEICLPKWAYAGIATIHIAGFNFEPSQGGVAITPEWVGPEIAIQPY